MGDPHGDPQTSPQHADPHGFLVLAFFQKAPSPCGSTCGGLVCGSPGQNYLLPSQNFNAGEANLDQTSLPIIYGLTMLAPVPSAMPNISTSFPPIILRRGASGWPGYFQEIWVSVEFPQQTPGPGNSGKFILGTPLVGLAGKFQEIQGFCRVSTP